MKNWFICRARYEKTLENGATKKVNEQYLIDAMSFTEAEARMVEMMGAYESGDYMIVSIKRENIQEVHNYAMKEHWYKIKAAYVTVLDNGKEQKNAFSVMIKADTTDEADAKFRELSKDSMEDIVVLEVKETGIVDVYFYETERLNDENR